MHRNQTASVDSPAADHVWLVLGTKVIDASCSSPRLRGLTFTPGLCLEHAAIVNVIFFQQVQLRRATSSALEMSAC